MMMGNITILKKYWFFVIENPTTPSSKMTRVCFFIFWTYLNEMDVRPYLLNQIFMKRCRFVYGQNEILCI